MSYQPTSGYDEEQYTQFPRDVKAGGTHLDPAMEPLAQKDLHSMKETDLVLKQRIRVIKLFIRVCTLFLAIFTVYTQVNTLSTYLHTRGIIRNSRNPWAGNTTIWPTIVLLSTSSLTVLYAGITILAYCWSVKKANAANTNIGVPMLVLELFAHAAVWIGTAVAYRVGKTGNDLWGWSCSPKADAIQTEFPEVNFAFFCSTQSQSWYVSIAQVVLFAVTCLAWGLAYWRAKHQKNVKIRESIMMSPALSGNVANTDQPTSYAGPNYSGHY